MIKNTTFYITRTQSEDAGAALEDLNCLRVQLAFFVTLQPVESLAGVERRRLGQLLAI